MLWGSWWTWILGNTIQPATVTSANVSLSTSYGWWLFWPKVKKSIWLHIAQWNNHEYNTEATSRSESPDLGHRKHRGPQNHEAKKEKRLNTTSHTLMSYAFPMLITFILGRILKMVFIKNESFYQAELEQKTKFRKREGMRKKASTSTCLGWGEGKAWAGGSLGRGAPPPASPHPTPPSPKSHNPSFSLTCSSNKFKRFKKIYFSPLSSATDRHFRSE